MWPAKSSLKPDESSGAQDFFFHLDELRLRLIVSLAAFAAAAVLSFFFSHAILDFLTRPIEGISGARLIFQKPHEAFTVHLKVAALAGLLASSPVWISQAWLFVAPGLFPHEKKILFWLIVSTTFLFLGGAAFAYAVILPWGLRFLLSFQTASLEPMIAIDSYFSFLSGIILAAGIFFDFPVALVGLVKLGILRVKSIARFRREAIVLIFIAAAVLTPSTDPVTQILFALPLILLFEISLFTARLVEKKGD